MPRSSRRRTPGDALVWIGIGSSAGALAVAAPVTTALTAAIVGLLLARAGARAAALAGLLVLALGFGRARAAVERSEAARAKIVDSGAWPARCSLVGRVSRSPSLVGDAMRVEIEARAIDCGDGRPLDGRVTLHVPVEIPAAAGVARDDEVAAIASVAPPYRFWNDDTFDPRPISARRRVVLSGGAEDLVVERAGAGVARAIDRARARVRARIEASFPSDTSAMARALVLGEDDLPEGDRRAFRQSGLAHLLAVSGMHLVLVVMGSVAAMRALLVRVSLLATRLDVMRVASALGLPVAWIYAELAGGSGSAVRAAWMCSVALLARALARRSGAWRSLGLSLLAMSLGDPLVVFDVSFVLSALATGGIVALARGMEASATRRLPWLPGVVVKPLATTAAATVACAPVLATMAPELPLGGLVANVVAVPLGEAAALPLCLAHALLSAWPSAESGCAAAASGALALVRLVARAFTWGAVPLPPPTAAQAAALIVAASGAALGRPRLSAGLGAAAVLALEVVARAQGAPRGVLRVTFVDVGQGDAALVDLPDGSAMLVDGGGLVGSPIDVGERSVAPLLAARRRGSLDAVVLTHPHPDHYLGLSAVLARVTPRAFWDTGQGEAEGTGGSYAELLGVLRARGVPVLGPRELCGVRSIGGAVVEVLAPCPEASPDRGANENSFVFRVRFGERAILFVGDAEREEESELVARHGARGGLRADVLKVGHHGSRTSSSPRFVDAVRPELAVVSCGVRNRFGHPHPTTLDVLARAGVRVLRTDRAGSVVVTTDGRSLDVRAMAGGP